MDKIAATTKGRIVSETTREKMRLAKLGKKQSDTHKANRSEALKGNKNAIGVKPSLETIEARASKIRGKARDIETIEKIRLGNIGKTRSLETRERQRQAALKRWRLDVDKS